ncbi:MAG: SpoIIE family protein phosphatase, partial [Phormidesmis sp.]
PRAAVKPEDIVLEQLRTPGMPIGMMPDSVYQWQRCSVPRNSRLYIFSDGIYEICPANQASITHQTLLGLDGFTSLLATLEALKKLSLDNLIDEIRIYGGSQFEDDLSLLEIDFQI